MLLEIIRTVLVFARFSAGQGIDIPSDSATGLTGCRQVTRLKYDSLRRSPETITMHETSRRIRQLLLQNMFTIIVTVTLAA
jgi:hypothetical protein